MKTKIFDYGMNGEGVAKIDNKITLIDNTLINEDVDVTITKEYKNYNLAKLNKIISPSPNRTNPPCPYYYSCGGCHLQHMTYDEELLFKSVLIKKTIKKITNLDVQVNNTIPCDTRYKYRNKITLNIDKQNIGFFINESNTIVDIKDCLLANDDINKIIALFREYLSNNKDKIKYVKHLSIRSLQKQILVGIVSNKDLDIRDFYDILNSSFNNIGLYLVINKRKDSVVLAGEIRHIAGLQKIKVNNYGLTYYVDLVSFHQTNENIQNKIYSKVLEYIEPNTTVVNGFSGQGLLSAVISTKAKHTIGIEINKYAHESAEELKKINNITNLYNILGDFNKEITKIGNIDVLILDPSKKGCGEDILSRLSNIKEIIYISCNPIALAKDLRVLTKNYDILEVIPFDMFPNTKSVETLVRLKYKGE